MNIVFHIGYSSEPWNDKTPGLGGTEHCVNKLAKQMALKGHAVFVVGQVKRTKYNINTPTEKFKIEYYPIEQIDKIPKVIDVLIGVSYLHFNKYYTTQQIGKKIFWLHNEEPHFWFNGTLMSGEEADVVYENCDTIVCLTKWHKNDFISRNPKLKNKIKVIGNGISLSEVKKPLYKVPGSYIYSSHAERGLGELLNRWPSIQQERSYATLSICTPGYGLDYYNKHFSEKVKTLDGVSFMGVLSTDALYNRLKTTETWLYPTNYNETYCITALEMMAHGVVVDTNEIAGLKETVNGFNKSKDWQRIDEYVQSRDWSNVSKEWFNLIEHKMIATPVSEPSKRDADMTYVICLDLNKKKEKSLLDRFKEFGFNSPITIWDACNGKTGKNMPKDYEVYDGWVLPDSSNRFYNREITPGEIGCAASHHAIWKDAGEKQYEKILILEEDFRVERKFNSKELQTEEPWTLMYLGCMFVNPPRGVSRYLKKPKYTYQTHAYMLTSDGVKLLLEQQFQNYFFAVDEFLPATYCDHPRTDLNFIFQDTIALAVSKSFIGQTSNSHTSTTEPGLDANRSLSSYTYREFVKKFVHESAKTKEWDLVADENMQDVYSYPLFTKEFCSLVIKEANKLNKWTKKRHDFYPTTDILLDAIGLNSIYSRVLKDYVYPCAIHKWHLYGKEWPNLKSENFMIKYQEDVQGHLSLHHDSGSISCVLTLNRDFEGGGTYFERQKQVHKGDIGEISIHPAQITHRHGGRPISKGERYIIVSFCSKP